MTGIIEENIAGPSYKNSSAGEDPRLAEWLRAPRAGERLLGISRAKWYQLAEEGTIRTVVLRQKGKMRGTRLFYGPDCRGLLSRLLDEQNPQRKGAA